MSGYIFENIIFRFNIWFIVTNNLFIWQDCLNAIRFNRCLVKIASIVTQWKTDLGSLLATSEQSREATATQRGWTNSCRYMCVYVYQWVCHGTCRVLGHRGRKVALHRRGLTTLTLQIHSPPTHSALNPSANPDKDRDYWNHHHLGWPTCPLVGGTLENTEHTLSTYDHHNRH